MGGFLFSVKQPGEKIKETMERYRASIHTFNKKGVELEHLIDKQKFSILVFKKISFSRQNYVSMANGDFILATGTLIYKGAMGGAALENLYNDFCEERDIFTHLIGHFCVFIYLRNKLYVFNDYNGTYHIYSNYSTEVLSSSWLGVRKTLTRLTISKQELYEYLLTGGTYGDFTLFREIKRLDAFNIHQIYPRYQSTPKNIDVPLLAQDLSFTELVDVASSSISSYFDVLRNNQANGIISALSGGFDSRLMFAAMRKVGIQPRLYVFGPEDSSDVRIAQKIGIDENLTIHHPDYDADSALSVDEFGEVLEKNFYFRDGFGIAGVFNDKEPDYKALSEMIGKYSIRLNGGAGEIFRNFWKLPDRSMTIDEFVSKVFGFRNLDRFSAFTRLFDRNSFLEVLGKKIKIMLQTASDHLSRAQIESIYTSMRSKYWMGPTTVADNLFSHALTPFSEPKFTIPSAHIPLKYKHTGLLEAAIINHLDPKLASYPSIYGFNFSDSIPKKHIFFDFIKRYSRDYLPYSLLLFLHKRLLIVNNNKPKPYYLSSEYVKVFLDLNNLIVADYVKIDEVAETDFLNRVLTAELNLQDRF